MLNALAALQALDDFPFLLHPISRDDHRDWPADCLVGRVTEDTLCALIPTHDRAIEILTDDRIVGRINDSGQQRAGRNTGDFWQGGSHGGSRFGTHGKAPRKPPPYAAE